MGCAGWSKVLLFLASCSVYQVTECSPSHHHHHPLNPSHGPEAHSLTNNNAYGTHSGQHHYSYAFKGPWTSSYQSVTRTFKHRPQQWVEEPHSSWQDKPWMQTQQKPWPQKPWPQKPLIPWPHKPWPMKPLKPTGKPWVHPSYPPLQTTPKPSVTKPATTIAPITTTTIASTTTTIKAPTSTTTKAPHSTITKAPTTMTPPAPTPAPIPDLDLDTDYFPFPAPLPLEDIDLPAGPPAILRPTLRTGGKQLQHTGGSLYRYLYPGRTYLQPWNTGVGNTFLPQGVRSE